MVHDDEQPSPSTPLSSSHCSGPRTMPSPHCALHVDTPLAFDVHTKPSSSAHADEQPSLSLASPCATTLPLLTPSTTTSNEVSASAFGNTKPAVSSPDTSGAGFDGAETTSSVAMWIKS